MGTFTSELTFGQYSYGTMVEGAYSYKTIQVGDQPSLDLILTSALDSRVTFTRAAGPATYFNSSGVLSTATTDTARFDHNPATLAAKGLLIEGTGTALALYSEQFNNAAWAVAPGSQSVTVTANTVVSPDGQNTGDTIVFGAVSGAQYALLRQGLALSTAQYAESIWVRATGAGDVGKTFCLYLNDGTAKGIIKHVLTASWQRISTTASGIATTWQLTMGALSTSNGGADQAAMSADVFGFGLEAGAFATSYTPTTSASATRAADYPTMTGSNFSSWWGASVGTIAVTATSPASGTRIVWQADDGTANNRITIYTTGTTVMADVVTGGVTQASLNLGTITADATFKVALRYGANDFSASLNGAACVTDTTGTVPTVDRAKIGHDTTGNHLCGTVSRVMAYQSGLGNSTLQSLTT